MNLAAIHSSIIFFVSEIVLLLFCDKNQHLEVNDIKFGFIINVLKEKSKFAWPTYMISDVAHFCKKCQ